MNKRQQEKSRGDRKASSCFFIPTSTSLLLATGGTWFVRLPHTAEYLGEVHQGCGWRLFYSHVPWSTGDESVTNTCLADPCPTGTWLTTHDWLDHGWLTHAYGHGPPSTPQPGACLRVPVWLLYAQLCSGASTLPHTDGPAPCPQASKRHSLLSRPGAKDALILSIAAPQLLTCSFFHAGYLASSEPSMDPPGHSTQINLDLTGCSSGLLKVAFKGISCHFQSPDPSLPRLQLFRALGQRQTRETLSNMEMRR